METEIIVYRGKNYQRYPHSKRRQLRVYFWHHGKWKEAPIALHRQIWIDNFGEIKKGFIVHHKDGNTFNNALSNLELMTNEHHASQHATHEMRKQSSLRFKAAWANPNSKLQKSMQSYWGSERSRENGRKKVKFLLNAQKYPHTCLFCGKSYLSARIVKSKFCSEKCGWTYRNHQV